MTYNKNPLSNNSALAYPSSTAINRYLNENTNINNTKLSSTNKLGHQSGKIGLKYDLFYVKNGDYFDDNDAAIINDDLNSSSQDYDDYDDLVEREEIVEECNEENNNNINMDNEDEPASKMAKLKDACESDSSDESSACLDDESIKLLSKEFSYICKNGFKWAAKNKLRPQIAITKYYKPTWKAKTNHYVKYSDIKMKDNNSYLKPSGGSITHRELVENLNEWKFHYVVSQVNNLVS